MAGKVKRDADGVPHSSPGSVDQQSEDTFPASDAPSFSPGAVGAPEGRKTVPLTSADNTAKVKHPRKRKAQGAA